MLTLETIFVMVLYLLYLALWKIKHVKQIKASGINPKVMTKSESSIQRYMYQLTNFITVYVIFVIISHAFQVNIGSLFNRIQLINYILFDIIGFSTGLIGLSLCLYAQLKMGNSWRVGIDEKVKTDLITSGLYKYIRNPTYLGLFLLNTGVWLIWPTWTVFILNLLFILFLEIQVRCEEDYLKLVHGHIYLEYKKNTKRYIPFVY